jgi:hypothetical protein
MRNAFGKGGRKRRSKSALDITFNRGLYRTGIPSDAAQAKLLPGKDNSITARMASNLNARMAPSL